MMNLGGMIMNIIQVNNLTKTYGDFVAVDHISFTVKKGNMFGFLGVNGAGKTTVINMLTTLLTSTEGTVKVCDKIVGQDNDFIREKIGIVYQQNCLDDVLSVEENLICRGVIHGESMKEAKKQCQKITQILKLEDILKKKYKSLSGGQKRRCEIAAALMHTPEILFLDEPTTGLDPATRKDVWETIDILQKQDNMTVFLTTHYMEEAAKADFITIIDHGHIITSGTPVELKDKYAKDKLLLYYEDHKEEILLDNTLEAISIINNKKDIIGFEVIQGTMDDVFLNATKENTNGTIIYSNK